MSRAYYSANQPAFFTARIEDDQGNPVPWSALTSVTLTVRDPVTGLFPSSRDDQDVLPITGGGTLNDVTIDASTGQLDWQIQANDLIPVDLTADMAVHVAVFKYEATVGGRPVSGELIHEMVILPETGLMLCSIDDVEHHLGRIQDADLPRVEREILAVSRRCENYTGRLFKYRDVEVDTFNLCALSNRSLYLLRYPVTAVASLRSSATSDFETDGAFTELTPGTDYVVDKGGKLGTQSARIRLRAVAQVAGLQVMQATYSGGCWRETGAVDQDLRAACGEQVAYRFQRRDALGITGMSANTGGSVTFGQTGDTTPFLRYEKDVLASVRAVWDDYRAFQPSF